MVQKSKQPETDECKTVVDGGKEGANEKDKQAPIKTEVTTKVQEESVKPEDDAVKTEVGTAEAASRRVIEGQKQEETKSAGEK